MLNLITVGFNPKYMSTLWNTIPHEYDVQWWRHEKNKDEIRKENHFLEYFGNINVFTLLTDESTDFSNFPKRMNMLMDIVLQKDKNGHFQIIDEDTLFHPNSYKVYRENKYFEGMIIGEQHYCNDTLRLKANLPGCANIDSGNVICHNSALKTIKWTPYGISKCPDAVFWENCYKLFGKDGTRLINSPVSYYNAQLKQVDEQDIYRQKMVTNPDGSFTFEN